VTEPAISLRPFSVGAEVLDLTSDLDDAHVRSQLYAAWMAHGVLVFHDIDTIERHLALSRCFGDLELHPIVEIRAKEDPYFMQVGGEVTRPWVYDETELKINMVPWHRDTAYTPNICKGAMLRMLEVPAAGGETMLADTAMAYDDLPADMKRRLDGLEWKATLRRTPMEQTQPGALWKTVRPPTPAEYVLPGGEPVDYTSTTRSRYPSVVHPAMIVHPESGRACVFLSPKEFDGFLGLDAKESDELFASLVSHMLQDRYVYTHSWSVNDAIVWDNRRMMHAAVGNRVGEPRRGLRTTLAGELCVGRLYTDPAGDEALTT
jgi:taurine dioxygenase